MFSLRFCPRKGISKRILGYDNYQNLHGIRSCVVLSM